jgi:hypothetical protein
MTERGRHESDGTSRIGEREDRGQSEHDPPRGDLGPVSEHVAAPTVSIEVSELAVQLQNHDPAWKLAVRHVEVDSPSDDLSSLADGRGQAVAPGFPDVRDLGG